ncbi:MAG: glutathione S-transferase C-terminal domain-containing protein [Hyphomicrobiaceae bacterium]
MKLYYMPGASSLLPHIVLVEAGLLFDAIRVDGQSKTLEGGGDYRTVNPLGYVPALRLDDGTVLTEAAAIAQYVADCAPAKNLAPPSGTLARAKLQSWLNFISSEMQLGCFCPLFDREVPKAVKAIFRRRLDTRLAHAEQHLERSVYLLGNAFSIGDVYLFVALNWTRPADVDLSPYPRLLTLRKRVGARPAVQEVMRLEKEIDPSEASS